MSQDVKVNQAHLFRTSEYYSPDSHQLKPGQSRQDFWISKIKPRQWNGAQDFREHSPKLQQTSTITSPRGLSANGLRTVTSSKGFADFKHQ